jgi:hypothetical protein
MTRQPPSIREGQMVQPHSVSNREQMIETMIELTRLSNLHRTIIAREEATEK